jgi:cell division protein FtsW
MDPLLLLAQFLLYGLSLLGVASSDSMPEAWQVLANPSVGDEPENLVRQVIYIFIALVATWVTSRIKIDWIIQGARPLALFTLTALVVVLFIGEGPAGVRRWIDIPGIPFNFQPSELAKLVTIIYLAAFFHTRPTDYPVIGPVVAVSLTAGLIIIEPDFDTGLFILLLAGILLVVIGVPWRRLVAIGSTAVLVVMAFSSLYLERFKYVAERFQNWLAYLQGDAALLEGGYQISQGQKLMVKAGLFGHGVGEPMVHRLPEGQNDMIFASIIWAGGWLAGLMVLVGFWLVLGRGLQVAAHTEGSRSVLAIGLVMYLGLQAAVNIGMVVGFLPVSGATLPLVSYGGSSMLITGVALGILHALSREAFALQRRPA